MKARPMLCALIAALTLTGAAGGYVAGHIVRVRSGDTVFFQPNLYYCHNHGAHIDCGSGDAFPWVELTGIPCDQKHDACGVTVKVHTLRDPQGGQLNRTYDKHGYPVYVFTAV